jgi:hypothetical protein
VDRFRIAGSTLGLSRSGHRFLRLLFATLPRAAKGRFFAPVFAFISIRSFHSGL